MRVRLMNLLFGLSLALLSCHPSARRCMTQAEMLLQERPDSALSLLQGLSGQRLTEKERARYALLTTIAQDKCYLDVNDDSLALFAYRYYSRYGDKQERMKASYYLGTIYQCAGDLIEATSFFKEAEDLALEIHDSRFLAYTKLRLAEVYASNYDHLQALSFSKAAVYLFKEVGEDFAADYAQTAAARQLYALHRYPQALSIADSLLDTTPIDRGIRYYSLLLKADICFHQKAYEDAKEYYLEAWGITLGSISILGHLAEIEEMAGNREKADSLIEQARGLLKTDIDSTHYLVRLQQIQVARGNYSQAFNTLVQATTIQSRAITKMLARSVTNAEKTYYEEAYHLKRIENNNLVLLFSLVVLLLFLIISFISFALYRRKKQVVQEMEKVEGLMSDLQNASTLLQGADQLMSALVKDKVAHMKDISELFFSWSDDALLLREERHGRLSKDNLVSLFRKELRALRDDKRLFTFLEDALNLSQNNVMVRLRSLFSPDSQRPLKELDFEIIMLFFAKVSPKSISFILDLSEESVRTRKYRYKKMFLTLGDAGTEFSGLLS